MEIEMRAVIFYYCRQGKRGKKIHHKLSDVYGKDSYSPGAVKVGCANLRSRELTFMMELNPEDL
jgi:hypothetical protein